MQPFYMIVDFRPSPKTQKSTSGSPNLLDVCKDRPRKSDHMKACFEDISIYAL